MGNLLENIQEVRKELNGLFTSMDVAMLSDERQKAEEVEQKLAEIEQEVGVFFSGQI